MTTLEELIMEYDSYAPPILGNVTALPTVERPLRLRLLRDQLLVRPVPERQGAIILPDAEKPGRRPAWGEVVEAGPDAEGVAPGDTVLFWGNAGAELRLNGEQFRCIVRQDVFGVVEVAG